MEKKKRKKREEEAGRTRGWFFSNSTLFCVIQPLPSCRCFTSGRWSYTGWTFCPLQFIKPEKPRGYGRRRKGPPLYSFCLAKLSATYPAASRRGKNYGQWRRFLRSKDYFYDYKWEYLLSIVRIFVSKKFWYFENLLFLFSSLILIIYPMNTLKR